jgi:hypothetical protein
VDDESLIEVVMTENTVEVLMITIIEAEAL